MIVASASLGPNVKLRFDWESSTVENCPHWSAILVKPMMTSFYCGEGLVQNSNVNCDVVCLSDLRASSVACCQTLLSILEDSILCGAAQNGRCFIGHLWHTGVGTASDSCTFSDFHELKWTNEFLLVWARNGLLILVVIFPKLFFFSGLLHQMSEFRRSNDQRPSNRWAVISHTINTMSDEPSDFPVTTLGSEK